MGTAGTKNHTNEDTKCLIYWSILSCFQSDWHSEEGSTVADTYSQRQWETHKRGSINRPSDWNATLINLHSVHVYIRSPSVISSRDDIITTHCIMVTRFCSCTRGFKKRTEHEEDDKNGEGGMLSFASHVIPIYNRWDLQSFPTLLPALSVGWN